MRGFPEVRVYIGAEALFSLALMLLLLPLRWTIGFLIAALVHETGHLAAVKLCRGDIISIRIGFPGTTITAQNLTNLQELLCVLAGPLSGLLLTLAGSIMPEAAICAGIQSIYNLLPISPLDGGQALSCLIRMIIPGENAYKLSHKFNNVFYILLSLLLLILLIVLKLKLIWVGLAIYMMLCSKIKIPCKQPRKRLQ